MTGRVHDMIIDPEADRHAARGHRRGRVLRDADLRSAPAQAPRGRSRHLRGGDERARPLRTTSSCWSSRSPRTASCRVQSPRPRLRARRQSARRPRPSPMPPRRSLPAMTCRPPGTNRRRPPSPTRSRCRLRPPTSSPMWRCRRRLPRPRRGRPSRTRRRRMSARRSRGPPRARLVSERHGASPDVQPA